MALKIGFIGCGGIARHHANQLKEIRGAKIVACSDVANKAAASFAEAYGAEQVYSDCKKMLASDAVEAVWVCTPTHLHRDMVIAAAKAGKSIFCEKPMALTVRDCDWMLAAVKKAGVLLTIGFVRQHDADWGTMRKLVLSGAVGRPVVWHSISGGPGPAAPWYTDAKQGAGPLMDGAVHNYNFAISMFGPGTVAQAASYTWNPKHTGQDTVSAIVRFEQGDELLMSWSWGMAEGARGGGFQQVVGPKGAISPGAAADILPKGFDPQTQSAYTVTGPKGTRRAVAFPKKNMFLEQAKHAVRMLAAGKQPKVTGADGRAAVAIAEAILKSAPKLRAVAITR